MAQTRQAGVCKIERRSGPSIDSFTNDHPLSFSVNVLVYSLRRSLARHSRAVRPTVQDNSERLALKIVDLLVTGNGVRSMRKDGRSYDSAVSTFCQDCKLCQSDVFPATYMGSRQAGLDCSHRIGRAQMRLVAHAGRWEHIAVETTCWQAYH